MDTCIFHVFFLLFLTLQVKRLAVDTQFKHLLKFYLKVSATSVNVAVWVMTGLSAEGTKRPPCGLSMISSFCE